MRSSHSPWFLLVIAAAVSGGALAADKWSDAQPGFAAAVDKLAGAQAVDCGFYNLAQIWPADDVVDKAYACAKRELASGHAFKYGVYVVHVDAPTSEAVVRSPDGKTWHLAFYGSIHATGVQKVIRECPLVKITPRLPIDARGCDVPPAPPKTP